jgi:predicted metal-dependent hydrolase
MPRICNLNPTYPFNFEINRSKRKSLAIYVKSGNVEIRAPRYASTKWIHEFVFDQKSWIIDELARQKRHHRQRLVIADGREIAFMGKPRTIVVLVSSHQEVRVTRDFVFLYTRKHTPENLEKQFNNWLKDTAREYMAVETYKIARQLGVQDKLKDIVFRKTKTKWGHCCQDGTIQYNWLSMMAPREVINYLIVHECSHLRHMDHSKKFWKTVERVCPNYQELRHWLAENGHRFWSGV